ncbi:photosystem reaction center subunit H [Synechococcus sp. Nb3U1]|uniref:photosystem reaction center subunit H n=1 Tax=Synechococcus sp. Nb3U1 TaxID=1914529 RepID=UPI001F1BC703|nr:photosystem reaction center subunit H [Synechococcus sp. Nb3U1]MCF2972173.1 photosystem reaction center subunit H [Synechococcus sp. Nb3U1]
MEHIIRRSQVIGLVALDGTTATGLGRVEEIWVDPQGRVSYFTSSQGYTPLEQISVIGPDALLTYANVFTTPKLPLSSLYKRVVRLGDQPVGWIEDFLFDWETGDIAAYILGGSIAEPWGGRAVLFPDDVEVIDLEAVVVRQDAPQRLKSEAEGLRGFLSEKSQQVKQLVQRMGDRLKSLVAPQDPPEIVRVKIQQVREELAKVGRFDHPLLDEATEYLQQGWERWQQRLSRAGQRMQAALSAAWQKLTEKD